MRPVVTVGITKENCVIQNQEKCKTRLKTSLLNHPVQDIKKNMKMCKNPALSSETIALFGN